MKKRFIMASVLASAMLVLAACGTSEEKTSGSGKGDDGDKTYRVVTDANYSPFEFQEGGKIVGFDVDVVKAVAKEAGIKVEIENVGWDPLFVEVKNKTADFGMSAISINDERKATYDFSVPYFLSTNKILVPEGSDIKSADDLKGKKVAVQTGTTGHLAVEKIVGKKNEDIRKFETTVLAIMEMKQNGAAAVVADNGVVEEYAKNNPKDKFVVVADEDAFENEYYGLMFPKDSELKDKVNDALKTIIDNGTYTEIYKEWFGIEPDVETLKEQQ
ncbi:glutamine ABC transporter substrate-binding protein [Bacillus sp. FJAT-27916]|uniref:basic amino acid ABC transporter substrate-binding protein n=1 Tax=Bacillaceae TaxID=186817 RepID=UPI0006716F6E|nr:basic amino acid ABC transporter substrate-binding protein [Bacillus sp. FJAT-27916]KMY45657.1 glutamine ABC transporter substrate-binding protein [Bacillus sp. FJAT-27916]